MNSISSTTICLSEKGEESSAMGARCIALKVINKKIYVKIEK